ncbi:MAG: 50S ribosomal protein L17, partial [Candidatus Peregrinibacteria bacterium GW2011_GWA2_47_7]
LSLHVTLNSPTTKSPPMQHRKKINKLGLKKSHRDALLKNLVASLVINDRINTTASRAKALAARFGRIMSMVQKKEPREAIRLMPNYCNVKAASQKLVNELKAKYQDRVSGFTRITRLSTRKGDNAQLVQIELI